MHLKVIKITRKTYQLDLHVHDHVYHDYGQQGQGQGQGQPELRLSGRKSTWEQCGGEDGGPEQEQQWRQAGQEQEY